MVPRRRDGRAPAGSTHSAARRTGCSGPAAAAKEEQAARHDPATVAARRPPGSRPDPPPGHAGRPPDRSPYWPVRRTTRGNAVAGRAPVRRYSGAMPTFPPLHQDLTFLSPLSEERADRLVAFLTEHEPATVLDVGCGWAELLLRVLEAAPRATGLGIDLDEESLAHARRVAADARARRARDLRGARRPRRERPVRRGHLHRRVPDLGARRRGGAAARLRRRPDGAAGAAPARRPAGLRRGDLVGAPDARRHGAAVRARRRVRHPRASWSRSPSRTASA